MRSPRLLALAALVAAAACSEQAPPLAVADPAGVPAVMGTTPLSATTIFGPVAITAAGTRAWQAIISGGNGTYSYAWQYRPQGTTTWTPVSTGSTYSRNVTSISPSFELRLTVTSGGASVVDTHLVSVNIPSDADVIIIGPSSPEAGEVYTWAAYATGGNGSYTYQWQYRSATSTTWSNVGTGQSHTRSVGLQPFYLRVVVTSGSATASDDHYVVAADPCGGQICP